MRLRLPGPRRASCDWVGIFQCSPKPARDVLFRSALQFAHIRHAFGFRHPRPRRRHYTVKNRSHRESFDYKGPTSETPRQRRNFDVVTVIKEGGCPLLPAFRGSEDFDFLAWSLHGLRSKVQALLYSIPNDAFTDLPYSRAFSRTFGSSTLSSFRSRITTFPPMITVCTSLPFNEYAICA